MYKQIHTIIYTFILFLLFFFVPAKCFALSDDFIADYDVSYSVTPEGTTIVTQNIGLTNQKSNVYPMQYILSLDSTSISNIIAYDPQGSIKPDVSVENGKTKIHLSFTEKRYGIGKRLPFSIRYESKDIAKHLGSVWEIALPGIPKTESITSYKVHLQTPASFGPIAYSKPPPSTSGEWILKPGDTAGIVVAYGTEQTYQFKLNYFLQNDDNLNREKTITLPPDTVFQKVSIADLTPKPKSVDKDLDGNWIASYSLKPRESIDILAQIFVTVHMEPRDDFIEPLKDPFIYTQSQPYWEASHAAILALSKDLSTPKAIYSYLIDTLTYNVDRVTENPERLGATNALMRPSDALCSEFTDAFIAIARAAQIPARRAVGYAYTNNSLFRPLSFVQDVLHTWPEYYDIEKGYWVPIDPTWASTTHGSDYFESLDFSHIVFAHQGISSELPLPAGFYKKAGDTTKAIEASFEKKSRNNEQGSIVSELLAFPFLIAGLPFPYTLMIKNTSGVGFADIPISVASDTTATISKNSLDDLPPFATVRLGGSIQVMPWYTFGETLLIASVNAQTVRLSIFVIPLYSLLLFLVLIIPLVLFTKKRNKHI